MHRGLENGRPQAGKSDLESRHHRLPTTWGSTSPALKPIEFPMASHLDYLQAGRFSHHHVHTYKHHPPGQGAIQVQHYAYAFGVPLSTNGLHNHPVHMPEPSFLPTDLRKISLPILINTNRPAVSSSVSLGCSDCGSITMRTDSLGVHPLIHLFDLMSQWLGLSPYSLWNYLG